MNYANNDRIQICFSTYFTIVGLAEGLEDGERAEGGEVSEVEGEVLQQGGEDGAPGVQGEVQAAGGAEVGAEDGGGDAGVVGG